MENNTRHQTDPLLTRREVETQCGLSTSSVYRLMRAGLFPEPIRIGIRAVRWRSSEINSWLTTRPRATGDRDAA